VTAASRGRFFEVVRAEPVDLALACLLIGCEVEPELDVDGALAVLDALAAAVGPLGDDPAAALQLALGGQVGFGGAAADYDDVRSSLLHEVLRRGRGLPILLAVVWCEVAARRGVRAVPLGLPGHVLVRIGADTVVDPFNGGRRVPEAPVEPVLEPPALLLRVLTNIRALTARQERSLETARTRLWATELSLLLPHHPVALRRERGELLVRLGDHVGGATELEAYASLVEMVDEQEAETARKQGRSARARLN
jgi:hypothetical protein